MSAAIEPQAPAPGWLKRWSLQASELTLRSLLVLMLGTIIFNILDLAVVAVVMIVGEGVLAVPLIAYGLRMISTLNIFWILQVVMRSDGHQPQQRLFSTQGLKLIMPFFVLDLVVLSLGLFLSGAFEPGTVNTSEVYPEGSGALYAVVYVMGTVHATSISSGLITMAIFGLFWAPLKVSVGIGWQDYRNLLQPKMQARMAMVHNATRLLVFVFLLTAARMPMWLSYIANIYVLVWMYVGAREIFGGIAENSAKEARISFGVAKPSLAS